jgi:hypothetical protein
MTVEYVRLLQIQRDLYDLPRGRERFDAYLRTMRDPHTGDLALPLVPMNPMGKEHVPALLDAYLAADAEGAAERAVAGATGIDDVIAAFRLGLVIADDLKGGWTNRYTSEFGYRFETRAFHARGWIVPILWTSETPGAAVAAREAVMAVHRTAYVERHGYATTLGQMLSQEGFAAAMAGSTEPSLEPDDLEYSRAVIAPLVDARDRATIVACLFGDRAARDLGYPPQGLSPRAGFAVALADAQRPAG